MAVTTSQIRDLLNRPRGLNEGTITEILSIRNTQVEKVSRGDNYGVAAENQITTDLKDNAVKMLACMDCLGILIDSVPTYVSEAERSVYDRRYQEQLLMFKERAQEALDLVSHSGVTTFATGKTKTRLESA